MTAALPAPARERFIRIAGMLGSAHGGERENAAKLATEILLEHGISWRQALEAGGPCPRCRDRETGHWADGHWRSAAARVLHEHDDLLNDFACRFLASIIRPLTLSPKQDRCLRRIVTKARQAGR